MTLPAAAQYEAMPAADIYPGASESSPSNFAVYDGRLFFKASDDSVDRGLWAYDSTTGEVERVADLQIDPNSSLPLAVYDDRLFISATDDESASGYELWAYDANADEVELIADFAPGPNSSRPSGFTIYEGKLFFGARTLTSGRDLWAYDADTDEVIRAVNINIQDGFPPFDPEVYNERLFFVAQSGLWAYDAATGNSEQIGLPSAAYLTAYDNHLFYRAYGGDKYGTELWVYDDTSGEQVFDIWPGPGNSFPDDFTVYDGRLFFVANDGHTGFELWTYDPQTGEVSLTADMSPGSGSLFPQELVAFNDELFFRADGPEGGELWAYNAANGEARLVADINPGAMSSNPSDLIVYGEHLLFAANDGQSGKELWMLTPSTVSNETPSSPPESVTLQTPYPNPAWGGTNLTFKTHEARHIRIEIYDTLGRRVALLADGPFDAGEHTLWWEPGIAHSGLYFVGLSVEGITEMQQITLIR